jgi:hypothetical protein
MHESISYWRDRLDILGDVRKRARDEKDDDLLAKLDEIDDKLQEFDTCLIEAQEILEDLDPDDDEDESDDGADSGEEKEDEDEE